MGISITQIKDIQIGHATDQKALTGCTVILCKKGATCGVDQRGGAPGTRETDLLRPMHLVHKVHAIVLSGGSAYGLDAACGVMKYLEENNIGFDTGVVKVPIVPAAILFDLNIGDSKIRPDSKMGYEACLNASNISPEQGNVGAGTGATVGKLFGIKQAMKSGIGTSCFKLNSGVLVGAIFAVNAFGDVIDPSTNQIMAGTRSFLIDGKKENKQEYFADTTASMSSLAGKASLFISSVQNTVIGTVITNARLEKEDMNKVAQMAQDGLARVVRPSHTMLDGDTIFALSTGKKKADVNLIGAYAAEATAKAILNAIAHSDSEAGLPSYKTIHKTRGKS